MLFQPLKIRDLVFKNRVFVSPMCQYSSEEGLANNWHLVHLGSRAVGGAALVMTEAAAVSPEGRISPQDLGIWNKVQAESLKPITKFVLEHGAVPAIQLAHAGRKASAPVPWKMKTKHTSTLTATEGGWTPVGPSPVAFSESYSKPHEMGEADLEKVRRDFFRSAELALEAGFQVIEIHMAHGYLMHEFLSPLSNFRNDQYGGSLENRMRFPLEVAKALRDFWPKKWPVFVRISATDWSDGGWDIEQSELLVRQLKELGIDLIDCSTGGNVPHAKIPVAPGYQVTFAESLRRGTGILTGAVGLITEPQQAEDILQQGQADVVFLARELLRDPYWPLHAAKALNQDVSWPVQYERAKL
jgi:2,4-dienoyl-CoA reductase-like NADH-dependent reductase (Old Yellow Enzyme family)